MENLIPPLGYRSRYSTEMRLIRSHLLLVAALLLVSLGCGPNSSNQSFSVDRHLRSIGAYTVSLDSSGKPDFVAFAGPIRSPEIGMYGTIRHVDLEAAPLSDHSLRNLASLKRIDVLHLTNTNLSDEQVSILTDFGSIGILRLCDTPISDFCVVSLARIPGLRSVDITGTGITATGKSKLLTLLPSVTIVDRGHGE